MALPMSHFLTGIVKSISSRAVTVSGSQITSRKSYCFESQSNVSNSIPRQFDESLLEYIVCPLTKEPLRYDKEKNELISDGTGVAYPIVNGIPNLVPQDGRPLATPTGK
ncbi:UPF0434 protein AM070-like [Mya arenaria]|uniref:UPF0434 protein AM070-like n=1 Tax=Mya arenaria TaxID=6604 RepID=UPI0022E8492F|nr:UPF0434 protein AM070-like [Mya arenaria]